MSETRYDLRKVPDDQMRAEMEWRSHVAQLGAAVDAGRCFAATILYPGGRGYLVLGGELDDVAAESLELWAQFIRGVVVRKREAAEPGPEPHTPEVLP